MLTALLFYYFLWAKNWKSSGPVKFFKSASNGGSQTEVVMGKNERRRA